MGLKTRQNFFGKIARGKVEKISKLIVKNIMTKQFFASIMVLTLVAMVVGVAVNADETVTATVTPQIVSVAVAGGTVNYGILDAGGTNNTFDGAATSDTQTITSGSNVSTSILIRSSDAAKLGAPGATDWELAGAISSDVFVHSYDINATVPTWTTFPSSGTFANISTGVVDTLVNNGNTATLDLKIDMPDSTSDATIHSITVTVVAIATN